MTGGKKKIVYQFDYQGFLVAEVGELVPELFGGNKLLAPRVATVATNSSDHMAVRQQLASPAQDGSQLMVPLFLGARERRNEAR